MNDEIIIPPDRDSKGRLLPGHQGLKKPQPKRITVKEAKRQSLMTHNEEVAQRRKAIHEAIGDEEMKRAILDIYNAALNAEHAYSKAALWKLFFEQVVGNPPKHIEIKSESYQRKETIDYSKLSQEELALLETVAGKVINQEAQT